MTGLEMKYFVLNPRKHDAYGIASRQAIREYARIIFHENPELAADLEAWLADLAAEREMLPLETVK